jgi:hypothetical protein
MAEQKTYYFSHDYNARNDLKLASLIADAGMEGCGIYWCLVEMLYEEGGYIKLAECERIAKVLRTQANAVRVVVDSDLFVKNEEYFYSPSVLKRLKLREERSEKARASALAGHNKGANAERTLANAERTPAIKGKERKKKRNNNDINIYTLWNEQNIIEHKELTPAIKASIEKTLKDYSVEDIEQAIKNYAVILKSPDYYFNYKWTLQEFLTRNKGNNIERFLDIETAKANFKRDENNGNRHDKWTGLPGNKPTGVFKDVLE